MNITVTDHDLDVALTTRYLTLTGIILLFHDHITSFGRERCLIWRGPRSFTNCVFLFNRYLVPTLLVIGFIFIGGFSSINLSDQTCWGAWITVATLSLVSLAIGNGVVTSHVVMLWEDQKLVQRSIWFGYTTAYLASALTMIFALIDLGHKGPIIWVDELHSCVIIKTSSLLVPVWAIPLAFECVLLGVLVWNAIDRPRQSHVSLPRALRNDGILHLLVLTLLRGVQTALVSTLIPNYLMILLFFIWAILTVTLSRSFLSMSEEEALKRARLRSQRLEGTSDSPVLYIGHLKETHRDDGESSSSH